MMKMKAVSSSRPLSDASRASSSMLAVQPRPMAPVKRPPMRSVSQPNNGCVTAPTSCITPMIRPNWIALNGST